MAALSKAAGVAPTETEGATRGGGERAAAPTQGASATEPGARQSTEVQAPRASAPVQHPRQFDQVMDRTMRMVRMGDREATLQLTPEHLGEMKIRIVMERGGVTAELLVHNQAARDLVESNQGRLQQALMDNGAESAQVNVSLGGHGAAAGSDADPRQAEAWPGAPAEKDREVDAATPQPMVAMAGGLSIHA
jgi:flagellar hook-length control protein FliK